MSSEEIYKDKNDIIKQLEEEQIIKGILEYTKNGTFPNKSPNAYLSARSKVEKIGSANQYARKVLFKYYKKTIQKYLDDCYKIISKETASQLIDSFIKQTEKINFLIYWMNRIFCYLDEYYLREKNNTLSKSAINLYKEYFFNLLENDIYLEVNKLIREDRKCNLDSRSKIKTILKIISDLDLSAPKIVKNNDIISWIQEEEGKDEKNETKYQDKWFDIFFKYETIRFAKDKGNADICNMSAIEYIKAQLKYFDEESIRQNEYINQKYHSKINEINYKYLIEEKAKELAEIDTGIPYMFTAKRNEDLKNTFQTFKLKEGNLKVIFNEFVRYINQRGREIIDNAEIVKDPKKFISKMIDLKKETEDLVSECFENHDLFRDYGLNGDIYAIKLSNYIDFYMRSGFKGKSEEEINNILNKIIDIFKIIKSKLVFIISINIKMNDRLVKGASLSINTEKVFISMLKKEQGPTYVSKMTEMIKDLEKNQKYIDSYKQSASKGNPNGIIFNVRIYRDMYWDIDKNYSQKMALPKYLSSCIEDFETFFFKNHSKDKLIWCLGLSRIQIQMLYLKNKNICTSTLPQLLILLQLEKNESLTIEQISELIGCDISTVLTQVHGLVFNPSFNPKHQPERGIILGTFNTNTQEFKGNDNIKINLNFIIEKGKFNTL